MYSPPHHPHTLRWLKRVRKLQLSPLPCSYLLQTWATINDNGKPSMKVLGCLPLQSWHPSPAKAMVCTWSDFVSFRWGLLSLLFSFFLIWGFVAILLCPRCNENIYLSDIILHYLVETCKLAEMKLWDSYMPRSSSTQTSQPNSRKWLTSGLFSVQASYGVKPLRAWVGAQFRK